MPGDSYAQVAIETTPNGENGASAISNLPFYVPATEFAWHMGAILDDRTDELRPTYENVAPDVVGFAPLDGGWKSRLYPNVFGLPMFMLAGFPTTTAGNGVITDPDGGTIPATATRHVWDSSTIPAAPRSAQVQLSYTDQAFYAKLKGVNCTGLAIQTDNNQVSNFDATLQALYGARQANPSLTPSYDALAVKPFLRSMHSLPTWLASSGTAMSIDYTFAAPTAPDYTLAGASKWPDVYDRTSPPMMTAALTLRYPTTADWDAFVAGTQFTVKSKWLHTVNIAATSYKYTMWIEGNAMYNDATVESLKHAVKHGMTIPVTFGKGASGSAWKVTIVDSIASYSSVS